MYDRKILFADRSGLRKAKALLDSAISTVDAPRVSLTDSQKLAIDYVKSSVRNGDIISIPLASYQLAQASENPPALHYDHAKWLSTFKQKPFAIGGGDVFLEIVDTRPESKTQVRNTNKVDSPHEGTLGVQASRFTQSNTSTAACACILLPSRALCFECIFVFSVLGQLFWTLLKR